MRGARLLLGLSLGLLVLSLASTSAADATSVHAASASTFGAPASYDATFTESGLPAATNWSVHVAFIGCGCTGIRTTVTSDTPTIVIPLTNGSYRFTVLRVSGYAVEGVAHGLVNVSGASPSPVAVTFYPVVLYPLAFDETGLPAGTSWTVHVSGNGVGQIRDFEDITGTSATSSIDFSLPNATYHYTVSPVNGSFFVSASHGTFVELGGSPASVLVTFETPLKFAVTFEETGLVAGMSWSVAVKGTAGVTIHETHTSTGTQNVFFLPNGTYTYRVATVLGYDLKSAATGTVTVDGVPMVVGETFKQLGSASLFLVDFNETGLAAGTEWTVHVAAEHSFGRGSKETTSTTGATDSFALQNGTYTYLVHPVHAYTLASSTGTVTVSGAAPPAVAVTFSAVPTYTVTFNETGLPNGTIWTILVYTTAGTVSAWHVHVTESTNSTSITFVVPNGSYCYKIHAVHKFHLTTGTQAGSFSVDGASPGNLYFVYAATK